jgi:hypothetical protein
MRKIKSKEERLRNYQFICRPDERLYVHDEAGPAADVGILFDLRILETIKGILQEVHKRCGENDTFERVNRRSLNRDDGMGGPVPKCFPTKKTIEGMWR